ncbi:MAG: hypothetical protein LBP55_00200 [Candidatus Adiutrix sp.]|nr:hypothetical protein [Candidatus Adiutrix sp.]
MFKFWKVAGLSALLAATALLGGCSSRGAAPPPAPFDAPMESRLILQVPHYAETESFCGPAALAALLTYNGRPTTSEKIILALNKSRPSAQNLVVIARKEGVTAEFHNARPEELLAAVRRDQPVIVRLGGVAAPPLGPDDYAVVVGYTADGPVVNAGAIHQQIVSWSGFLAAWHQGGNLMINIEPLS